MTNLTRDALACVPLPEETVRGFYDRSRSCEISERNLKALCASHERLRAELQGAEILIADLADEPSRVEIRRLTTALHANLCHPDFAYIVCPPESIAISVQWKEIGWEPNPEYPCAPGDQCWRRKKEPS